MDKVINGESNSRGKKKHELQAFLELSVLSSKGIITFHGHAFLLPVREEVLYGKEFSQREVLPTQVVINDFGITTVLNQENFDRFYSWFIFFFF